MNTDTNDNIDNNSYNNKLKKIVLSTNVNDYDTGDSVFGRKYKKDNKE